MYFTHVSFVIRSVSASKVEFVVDFKIFCHLIQRHYVCPLEDLQ